METERAASRVHVQLTELSFEVVTTGTSLRIDEGVALVSPCKHVVAEQRQSDVAQIELANQRFRQLVSQSDVTQFDERLVEQVGFATLAPAVIVVVVLIVAST